MTRGPTHRSGTHRIDLRLGPDARALVDAVREAQAPTAEDKARVRRALFAALAAGAATSASAATASAAVGAACGGGSTASVGVGSAAGVATSLTGSAAGASAAAVGATGAATGTALGITSTSAALAKFAAIAIASAALGTALVVGPAALRSPTEVHAERAVDEESAATPVFAGTRAPVAVLAPHSRAGTRSDAALAALDDASGVASAPVATSRQEPALAEAEALAGTSSAVRGRGLVRASRRPAGIAATDDHLEASSSSVSSSSVSSSSVSSSSASSSSASLVEEMSVLRAAWRAIREGDSAAALARLDAHGARFPGGALAQERDAARVIALCLGGRVDEGERASSRFLTEHPGSLLASRVSTACARR